MASRKKKNNIMRIIGVLCGCLGAGWLFSYGWNGLIELCLSYKVGNNIFYHFFSSGLFALATLITAVLFFVVSIRDLAPMKEGVAIASVVIYIIVAVVFVINIVNRLAEGFVILGEHGFLRSVMLLVLLVSYGAFAFYCLKPKNSGFAWTAALVAVIGLAAVAVFGYATHVILAEYFINTLIFCLAHLGVFYCGLKQY